MFSELAEVRIHMRASIVGVHLLTVYRPTAVRHPGTLLFEVDGIEWCTATATASPCHRTCSPILRKRSVVRWIVNGSSIEILGIGLECATRLIRAAARGGRCESTRTPSQFLPRRRQRSPRRNRVEHRAGSA